MAAALGDRIAAVQADALQAIELEVAGDVHGATSAYMKTATQLQYLLDVCMPQAQAAGDAGAVCRGLLDTYLCRMEVLRSRGVRLHLLGPDPAGNAAARAPAHWVGVDAAAAERGALYYDVASATSASDATPLAAPDPGLACGGGAGASACLVACGAGGRAAAAVDGSQWAGGSGGGGAGGDGSDGERAAAKLELLRQCQRSVEGGLDDVIGLEPIKDELDEAIFMPLHHPHLFKGIRKPPRHFLLYGPPGTGKTLLVEKVAAEAGFTLLALSPSGILSKWSGESEKALALAFDAARAVAPSLLLLDEVDALGRARASAGDDAAGRRLLTELLLQMNGLGPEEGVYVFGATNRMADCDPALLRRFDRRIEVPNPDAAARAAFLTAMLERPEVDSRLAPGEVAAIAAATEGFSGSDMAGLCRHAAMAPVRELLEAARAGGRKRRRAGSGRAGDVSGGAAATAGGGGGGMDGAARGSGGGLGPVRKLVVADFEAALSKIRPAAVDARRA